MSDNDARRRRDGAGEDSSDAQEQKGGKTTGKGLGRREFVKLVGGAGAVVSAGVLAGEGLLAGGLEAQEAAGRVMGPGAVPMTLRLNGLAKNVTLEPRTTLLDALRNHLDLTGAKKVCDRGTCGSCTVLVGGEAMYACSILAIDVADRGPGKPGPNILTIEGLAPNGKLHDVSKSFVDNDAQQCGFCTPGFVMACVAYLKSNPNPTYEQVKQALGGNLCRCGTYMGVRKAVLEAATRMKGGRA